MTTPAFRQSELSSLLQQMRDHPSRDRSGLGERAYILARMLARESGAPRRPGR